MTSQSRPYTFDRVVRLLIGCAIFAFIIWLLDLLKDVLLPFCVACLIAYLFEPFVQYNRSLLRLKGRITAIFVTLFEALVFFGILLYMCVPSIITEMHQMADLLRNYANSDVSIQYLPPEIHDILKSNIDFEELAHTLMQQDMRSIIDKGMTVIHGGVHVVLGVVAWLIVFLYVIFIMLDYDRLMRGFKLLVPPRFRPVAYKVGNDIKESMNHYFRGQALIACVVAVIYCVGFSLCGLPLAIVLGLGTAVLFMIPYCQYLSIIPVTLLCLVDSANSGNHFWTQWWECMGVFLLVQIVADLILTPRIMGKAMGLNPAIILLSLSIWGSLFGLIGMIIALPLTTLLLSYYEQYVIMRNDDEPPSQRLKEVEEIKDMSEMPFKDGND
ncbi:MAG: AI-2E family transporter [Muribaculaceae bacterium]|jgi:predicted PurR-regulated permease PerM